MGNILGIKHFFYVKMHKILHVPAGVIQYIHHLSSLKVLFYSSMFFRLGLIIAYIYMHWISCYSINIHSGNCLDH